MKLRWADITIATVLLAAGCAAIYGGLARLLRRAIAERAEGTDRQMRALSATVQALQARVAELHASEVSQAQEINAAKVPDTAATAVSGAHSPLKQETLATLTAAATAFLGRKAKVRSARALPVQEGTAAWAQQGRVFVQTSHNVRSRQ